MKKVVIIGAGPAGLTAGLELLRRSKDYEVTILEESDAIGGISRTVKHNGNRMDIGGHRFFTKIGRVNEFWTGLMPLLGAPGFDDRVLKRTSKTFAGGPDPEKEDDVMLVRRRVSRIYYKKKFFDYPVSLKLDTIKNMGFLTTVSAGFSYLYAMIFKRSEDNLENFYVNRFGKKLYQMFFEGYTKKLWGRHPSQISADWGAQRVKGLSIMAVLKDMLSKLLHIDVKKETSLIEEFWYPKFGPGQLWECAAKEFESLGGKLIMNTKAVEIKNTGNYIKSVKCEGKDGISEYEADIFISSMPLKDLVVGMENVPENIDYIARNLPYRDFVTVGLKVKKLNLKNETDIKTLGNIVPDCWIYVQDTFVRLGRIQIFNNWSPYMVENPEEYVFLGLEYFCDEKSKFFNAPYEKHVEFATKELIKMGIIESADDVVDSHRECVKKAYPAYFDTYNEIDKLIEYLDTFDNLYCVGRNGQHRYNNMDHSMMTSFLTVDNILSNRTDKSNIWNVNTESEYHEEKCE